MKNHLTQEQKKQLLQNVLADVSRAFYLSIRVLPAAVREPIGLAYLLARAADTLADNPYVETEARLADLEKWLFILTERGDVSAYKDFWSYLGDYVDQGKKAGVLPQAAGLAAGGITDGEGRLLLRLSEAYSLYLELDTFAQQEVLSVVSTLIEGMKLDLASFPGAFNTDLQLENYTYLVAGCVGQFWSRINAHYLGVIRDNDLPMMEELGISFGKALQYVNVLRDFPKDLKCGRLYIPCSGLADFLDNKRSDADLASFKVQLKPWIIRAVHHFRKALSYIKNTPKRAWLLRLSTVWPVAIGLGTLLEMVRNPHWPDFSARVKVSRLWVYAMMLISLFLIWSNRALDAAFWLMEKRLSLLWAKLEEGQLQQNTTQL
ncbi:MAG: squalene/phytoene synthase family protein [Candidatus Bruticola sp.]